MFSGLDMLFILTLILRLLADYNCAVNYRVKLMYWSDLGMLCGFTMKGNSITLSKS